MNETARTRHYLEETQRFGLKPWECRPVDAVGAPPTDQGAWATSWPKARELRRQILDADPHHYDDLKRGEPK